MSPEDRILFQQAVQKTTELFKKRTTARDWSDNIIQGSSMLNTKNSWKHYYAWLGNPQNYNEEQTDQLEVVPTTEDDIGCYDKRLTVSKFKNGNETLIHIKNPSLHTQNDEKQEG